MILLQTMVHQSSAYSDGYRHTFDVINSAVVTKKNGKIINTLHHCKDKILVIMTLGISFVLQMVLSFLLYNVHTSDLSSKNTKRQCNKCHTQTCCTIVRILNVLRKVSVFYVFREIGQ